MTELTAEVLSTDVCGISPAQRVEFNWTYVGPTKAVFGGLDPDAQRALAAELAGCLQRFNRATDDTLVASAEYLQVVAARASSLLRSQAKGRRMPDDAFWRSEK